MAPTKGQKLGGPPGRHDPHDQHHQQGGKSSGREGQGAHHQDHKRVIQGSIMAETSQPKEDRNPEQADQRKVGQDRLQHFGDKDGSNRQRRGKQKIHIAGKIHGLQQHTEARE